MCMDVYGHHGPPEGWFGLWRTGVLRRAPIPPRPLARDGWCSWSGPSGWFRGPSLTRGTGRFGHGVEMGR